MAKVKSSDSKKVGDFKTLTMKTAMKELIEELEVLENNTISMSDKFLIKSIRFKTIAKLEKEKEQIVDAYRTASINNAPNEDFKNVNSDYWQLNAELWYDKYYNQNK